MNTQRKIKSYNKLKLKLKKIDEIIFRLKKKSLTKEKIIFEDLTDLSNRVGTLLDIVIHDTKPTDEVGCITGTIEQQRRYNE